MRRKTTIELRPPTPGANGKRKCLARNSFAACAAFAAMLFMGTVDVQNASADEDIGDGFLTALTMHQQYAAWNSVRDRTISGSSSSSAYRGQTPCEPLCDPCDPCGGFGKTFSRSAWVNYSGRSDTYRSAFNGQDWKTSMEGVQAGADLYRSSRSQLGVIFGYEGGKSRNAADRIKADDIYAGAYAARVFRNGADARVVFAYGYQDYDMTRTDAASDVYISSFKGYTTETTVELGKRYSLRRLSVRPTAAVDVFNNNLKAAQETGTSPLSYGKTSLTQAYVRVGTGLRYEAKHLTLNSGIYYAYDINGQDLKTSLGASSLSGSKLGRELLTYNLGSEYQLSKRASAFGGYQGSYALDGANKSSLQHIGYAGLGWKW